MGEVKTKTVKRKRRGSPRPRDSKYPVQIVAMFELEQGGWVRSVAKAYGVSQAQVVRDCTFLARTVLEAEYGRRGLVRA